MVSSNNWQSCFVIRQRWLSVLRVKWKLIESTHRQSLFVCWLFFLRALQSQRVETHTRWMDAYRLSDGAFDIERLPINFMCAQFPVALVMAQARHCIDLDQDSRSYKTTRHHTIQLYIHQNLVLFVITFNCYHRSNSKAQIDKCHFQSTFLINVNATRR